MLIRNIKYSTVTPQNSKYLLNLDSPRVYVSISESTEGRVVIRNSSIVREMAEIAKKFTFYRVRDAPSKSGIKKGKSDNGLITCTSVKSYERKNNRGCRNC